MPLDRAQLRLALLAAVDGGDAIARLAARRGGRLDSTRADSQTFDAIRLANKPGTSATTIAAAYARAGRTRSAARTSARLAARATITPFPVSTDHAYLHGLVVDPDGVAQPDLEVRAYGVDGGVAGAVRTDSRGYFLLDLRGASGADPTLTVFIFRDGVQIYRDGDRLTLRLGYSRYREIIVRG